MTIVLKTWKMSGCESAAWPPHFMHSPYHHPQWPHHAAAVNYCGQPQVSPSPQNSYFPYSNSSCYVGTGVFSPCGPHHWEGDNLVDAYGRVIRRRSSANKKERRRTQSINNAFIELRDCIPNVPPDTKLSKIKTIRLATTYISYLMEVLRADGKNGPNEAFKAELPPRRKHRQDEKKYGESSDCDADSSSSSFSPERGSKNSKPAALDANSENRPESPVCSVTSTVHYSQESETLPTISELISNCNSVTGCSSDPQFSNTVIHSSSNDCKKHAIEHSGSGKIFASNCHTVCSTDYAHKSDASTTNLQNQNYPTINGSLPNSTYPQCQINHSLHGLETNKAKINYGIHGLEMNKAQITHGLEMNKFQFNAVGTYSYPPPFYTSTFVCHPPNANAMVPYDFKHHNVVNNVHGLWPRAGADARYVV